MKTWKIFFGVGLILIAVVLVLDALGILAPISSAVGPVSILACVAGLLLLSYTVAKLIKGKISEIFIPLALVFMLFEKNIAFMLGREDENIINNWLILGCAALVSVGFSILFSGLKRKNRRREHICGECGHRFSTGNLGTSVKYIDCDGFKFESIENNIGSYTVFFENVDKYEGGGVLEIENNLGSMDIHVPTDWHIIMQVDNSLGATSEPDDIGNGPTLTIRGDNNLGSVSVDRV